MYVNNNGNVTFDEPLSDYTPFNLTGDTGIAMIAPYCADIDTGNVDSLQTTYGSSGNSFWVNWVDVGFYDERADKLFSAQLIIEDRSDLVPGALIDAGANALFAGSRNSSTPGSYVFDVGLGAVGIMTR